MNRKFALALCLGLASLILSPVVYAAETLIAGTGGSPPVTQSSFAILSPGGNDFATSFTVPAGTSYTLSHLQVAAYHYPGNGGSATFTINPSVAGVPGAPLTTFNTATVESFTEATAGLTLSPSGTPVLQAGQKYWLVGRSNSDQVNWVHGFFAFGETASSNGASWNVHQGGNVPAFAVLGVAVPEPSTLMLLSFALAAMFLPRSGISVRH
jgi:hypothetical protein